MSETTALRPLEVQRAFDKQVHLLAQNLHHPSLDAKKYHANKYKEATDLWQARVNLHWRFHFLIRGDTYLILMIIPHPK